MFQVFPYQIESALIFDFKLKMNEVILKHFVNQIDYQLGILQGHSKKNDSLTIY